MSNYGFVYVVQCDDTLYGAFATRKEAEDFIEYASDDPHDQPCLTLSEEEWKERFIPLNWKDGTLRWPWAPTTSHPLNHVWTIIAGEDGNEWVTAGVHIVNRTGDYCITAAPWVTGEEQACLGDWVDDPEPEREDDYEYTPPAGEGE